MTPDGPFQARDRTLIWSGSIRALSASGFLIGVLLCLGAGGVRLNTSPSLPIGLYMATSNPQASLAEFCPDEPAASLGISRGYRSRGSCPDGGTPLLKPIVAAPGDTVQVTEAGLAVNGRPLPNTQRQSKDTRGRSMPVMSDGTYAVAPGTLWVASTYDRRSFDSRYFGPIQVSTIRCRLRPLLTK